MKININGITREMTAAEIAQQESVMVHMQEPAASPEERISALEEALEMILAGVTE